MAFFPTPRVRILVALTLRKDKTSPTRLFEIVVDIDSDSGEETEWDRGKLSPGPAQFTVHAPHRYTVRIDVEVAGKPPAAVTFTARILKPGGTQFGDAFSFTTPAQEGSYLATLGIVTEAP